MSKDVELNLNGKVILLVGVMESIYKITQTLAKDGNTVSVRNRGETEWMPVEVPDGPKLSEAVQPSRSKRKK